VDDNITEVDVELNKGSIRIESRRLRSKTTMTFLSAASETGRHHQNRTQVNHTLTQRSKGIVSKPRLRVGTRKKSFMMSR